MTSKDFDAMLAAHGRPTFTVAGQTFTAKAKLPWKKFTRLLAVMTDPEVPPSEGTEKFLTMAVIRADRQRFLDLLNRGATDDDEDDDDERCISPEQVRELSEFLMEHYTGKQQPTDEPSSDGPPDVGLPRKVVSLTPRTAAG